MPSSPAAAGFPRRTLLAVSAAGLGLLVAGCTSSGSGSSAGQKDQATDRQTEALAVQVTVQQVLVAAYAAAGAAAPSLAAQISDLATQAVQQLDRLKAAAPERVSSSPSAVASSSAASLSAPALPAGQDPKTWLRAQVASAADAHAAACLDQTGARAALLGSIAAGLRGQAARLA